jgi:hypothetical protein
MESLHRNDDSEREPWSYNKSNSNTKTKSKTPWGRENLSLHSAALVFLKIALTPPTSS